MKSPFKFLDSYTEQDYDIFFGREKETEDIYDALSGVKHLLVYGPSGVGKTSLIECGLRNKFSDADWYALTIRRGTNLNKSIITRIQKSLSDGAVLDTNMPLEKAIERLFDERFQPIYLLFDQFEELLISGTEIEKKEFFEGLNNLIYHKVPCRVILIMREEFIGHLSEYEKECPSIFQYRFRLEKMSRTKVREVILNTLQAERYRPLYKVKHPSKLTDSIINKLPDSQREIELTHVQVFLGEIWDRASAEQSSNYLLKLNEGLVKPNDNLQKVLNNFLKKQLNELDVDYAKYLPLEVLVTMISERYTKLQMSAEDIFVELQNKRVKLRQPLPRLLLDLKKRRIIRIIKSGDETKYEISHDVLAEVIGNNRTDDMKKREKARFIYKAYAEDLDLYSQKDLALLSNYEKILPFSPELKRRIEESFLQLKEEKKYKQYIRNIRIGQIFCIVISGLIIFGMVIRGFDNVKSKVAEANKKAEESKTQIQELKIGKEQTFELLMYSRKILGEFEQQRDSLEILLGDERRKEEILQQKNTYINRQLENSYNQLLMEQENKKMATQLLEHSRKITEELIKQRDSLESIIKNERIQKDILKREIAEIEQQLEVILIRQNK